MADIDRKRLEIVFEHVYRVSLGGQDRKRFVWRRIEGGRWYLAAVRPAEIIFAPSQGGRKMSDYRIWLVVPGLKGLKHGEDELALWAVEKHLGLVDDLQILAREGKTDE